ncbi:hypothetical protein MVES_001196 [Malassezia vespertilionis]|uniref:Transcription factor Iwr1 domain-containing protein n=1 Tax=Malassezia vespertilionis TaxID=2020962 RepID=A0A2N1JE30_9BASI|nr:hypothetical protein MVES_001196 [Malassezia vespertilionis]
MTTAEVQGGIRKNDEDTDTQTILRVKRKRIDSPVDAFVFQLGQERSSKRHGTNDGARGVFRLAETNRESSYSVKAHSQVPAEQSASARIIEAEWDAAKHKVAIKRKRGADSDDKEKEQKRKQGKPDEPVLPNMDHFAGMLADYLNFNDVQVMENTSNEYVYDIYFRELLPQNWRVPSHKKSTIQRESASRGPPQIGRAKTSPAKHAYSPVPAPRASASDHPTSAPGFEHLSALEENNTQEDWESEADLFPIYLRPMVDEHGETIMMPVSLEGEKLTENSLVYDEQNARSLLGEDEDSNDEDFYANDYPDGDEDDSASF